MPITPRVWISKIKFNDGKEIGIEKNGITVLVGPNNAGKSVSLGEIDSLLQNKNIDPLVIKDVEIEKEGDEDDLIIFLDSISKKKHEPNNPLPTYSGFLFNIYESNAKTSWSNFKSGLTELKRIFVNLLTTEARLTAANPPANISITTQPPQHPTHFLQRDDRLEKKFSDYFKQAFKTSLTVHRNAGSDVPLLVGNPPQLRIGEDRISYNYLERLEKLPFLHRQGDGMRSFVGVLLNTLISDYSVILIDEPEAFLHPPQAKLLGKMLSRDLPSNRQLILATHSEDLLKGLLESDTANLKIIRIQREENINKVSELDNDHIRDIWKDPLLRYSNILSGVFHPRVILCESDSDCRFYSAMNSSVFGDEQSDILFVHSGGKHRMPTVIDSLKKLDVPINVIADFDVLRNENDTLKKIFESLGGSWDPAINSYWKLVKDSIDSKKAAVETEDLKKEIEKIFSGITDKNFPQSEAEKIRKLLRKSSAWSYTKEEGRAFVPAGDPTNALNNLFLKLNGVGLFVVEIGELESFDKTIGNHGPKWLNSVLKKNLSTDIELEEARKFIKKVIGTA